MSLRPIEDAEFTGPHGYTRVYYDSDWQEYRVKLWQNHGPGRERVREKNSDYHTDDRLDALETAQRMVEEQRYAS
jgi:hypothetical protein